MLSLIHVLEWRAAVTPDALALTDVAAIIARNQACWGGRDRRVS